MKRILVGVLIAGLVFSFAGCKKKEQKPQLPPGHPSMEGAMPPAGMPGAPKVDRTVVVPKDVKAKWKAVKLIIEDRAAKGTKEYTVNIGSDLAVPNTNIKVKVLAFLPHFVMSEDKITSASNDLKMPAAQILVQEPGKEDRKAWLFSKPADVHPFMHEKIGIKLAGGVSK